MRSLMWCRRTLSLVAVVYGCACVHRLLVDVSRLLCSFRGRRLSHAEVAVSVAAAISENSGK